jgi:hypothetical protein
MSVKQVFNTSAELDYPTVLPTLDLDFANSKTLDPRITFTRASGGSYVGADGLIKYAGVNEARFDHDPITGESLGLLIEESRMNLVTNSTSYTGASFNGIVTIDNSIISPDGALGVQKLTSTVDSGIVFSSTDGVITNNTGSTQTYCWSVFVKKGYFSTNLIQFQFGIINAGIIRYNFDTDSFSFAAFQSSVVAVNYGRIFYPNGWVRIYGTYNIPNSLTFNFIVVLPSVENIGGKNASVYHWGSQVEVGSFPTSYIPTQASTRTRASDNAIMIGKNFSSWYRQDEGTYSTVSRSNYGTHPPGTRAGVFYSSSGGTANYISLAKNANSSTYASFIQSNAIIQASIVSDSTIALQKFKAAFGYSFNNFAVSYDGTSPLVDSTVITPTMINRLLIGRGIDGGWWYNGTISRFTYFPKRLPNAQLQALTS